MLDQQGNTPNSAISWFRVKAQESSVASTVSAQLQAIESLCRLHGPDTLSFHDITLQLLREWATSLLCSGYTLNTVAYYLKHLSSLYGKAVKENLAPKTDAFTILSAQLRDVAPSVAQTLSEGRLFEKLRMLILKDLTPWPGKQLAKDMLLFSIYNGGMSLTEVATFRKTAYTGDDPAVQDIIDRYSRPRNRYLFPLSQPERTAGQLRQSVRNFFQEALLAADVRIPDADDWMAAQIWGLAATRCGITPGCIAACVSSEATPNPLYSFATPAPLSAEDILAVRRSVSRMLAKDPYNWYAMQFRPRVDYEAICLRLRDENIELKDVYYPLEEIVKRIGKKIVSRQRPVVPGLLFFRSKASDLTPLFRSIGDLAWCYRQTRQPQSPYAIVSEKAIRLYQQTIGQFSHDMEIYPGGTLQPRPGDRVEIIGGDFMGYPAIFDSEIKNPEPDGPRTIYRLRLIGDNDIEWQVATDPRLVRPGTETAPIPVDI